MREEGGELLMSGVGRTFRTNECWEQSKDLTRATHSAADHVWRTTCKSAPNDPRQTTLVTIITASDSTIALDETGEYQFRIEGQNCTASTRRTRNFVLFQRQGQAPPNIVAVPPAGVQPEPTAVGAATPRPEPLGVPQTVPSSRPSPSARCASPGDPARLEVRPARKWLSPGQRFTFRAIAFDADGCVVDARLIWTLATPNAKITMMPGGSVAIADDAEDGTIELGVSFAGRSVPIFIEVATPARYEALGQRYTDAGEGDEAATTIIASGSLGANPPWQKTRPARARRRSSIVGGLAIVLAGLGFVYSGAASWDRRAAPYPAAAMNRASPRRRTAGHGPPAICQLPRSLRKVWSCRREDPSPAVRSCAPRAGSNFHRGASSVRTTAIGW